MKKELRRIIRKAAGTTYAHPIEIVDGNASPKLVGNPYWKTSFSAHGGRFKKILYTPSTQKIVVGQKWLDARNPEVVYNRD